MEKKERTMTNTNKQWKIKINKGQAIKQTNEWTKMNEYAN